MQELPPELKQATQNLGNALKSTPLLSAYAEAVAKMEADAQATALLDELQQVQADIRARQSNGGVTADDTTHLRQLQSEVQARPTIAAFLAADQQAKAYLPQVNQAISNLLGIDFASLGRVSGCC
ncbi:hypothetical protein ANRL1_04807 [Anaerolineae bacterium]|nr:hypothetical protein ANRL1_04807 [Anaerolineae bacterium]